MPLPVVNDWQEKASCRSPHAIELFFPPSYSELRHEREQREAQAKVICSTCPVQTDCLTYAITIREPHGIWGGLNETERKQLISGRSAQTA